MKKLFPVFAGILSLGFLAGGCSKSATEEALSGMKGFKTKMCACKTIECADKVDEEQDKWEDGIKSKGEKPDDAFIAKWEKVKDEYRSCRDDVNAGGK